MTPEEFQTGLPGSASLDKFAQIYIGKIVEDKFQLSQFENILDVQELKKSGKFIDQKARDMYITGRYNLRTILGEFLNLDPKNISFSYNAQGKPFLSNHQVFFNLTHSRDLWALAISSHECGVDIEYISDEQSNEGVANRFFHDLEKEVMAESSEEERLSLFYELWTRKEALLKNLGGGISMQMARFNMLDGENNAELVEERVTLPLINSFKIISMRPFKSYWLSFAIDEEINTVRIINNSENISRLK